MAFTAVTVSQESANINHTNQRSVADVSNGDIKQSLYTLKHLNTSLKVMKRNKSACDSSGRESELLITFGLLIKTNERCSETQYCAYKIFTALAFFWVRLFLILAA